METGKESLIAFSAMLFDSAIGRSRAIWSELGCGFGWKLSSPADLQYAYHAILTGKLRAFVQLKLQAGDELVQN
jgi:hypothetical protein